MNPIPDNTRSLIINGLLTVTLPVGIALLGPVAAAAIWIFRTGNFLLWPLFAGMLAGLVFSYFVYRFASPRWLARALQRSSNLPHFKRKAIRNGLMTETDKALLNTDHFVDDLTLQKWNEIDQHIALHDNPDLPREMALYSQSNNRLLAMLASFLFLLALAVVMVALPRSQWSVLLNFLPLLLIAIFFSFRKEKKQWVISISDEGIRLPAGEWSWSQITTVRYSERRSSTGSPGRAGYFSHQSRALSFKTTDGITRAVLLNNISTGSNLEEQIAVYRYRHLLKRESGYKH